MKQSRVVHITSGLVASDTLRQALRLEINEVLAFGDTLDGGPIINFDAPELWSKVRNNYLKKVDCGSDPTTPFMTLPSCPETAPDILRQADKIYFWVARAVYEQLLLPWVIKILPYYGVGLEKLFAVEAYEPFESKSRSIYLMGVGVLKPDQLQRFFQPRFIRHLTADDIKELTFAWNAITAPSPEQLTMYCKVGHRQFPWLQQSLRRFMCRYPDMRSGLSHFDMLLLRESKTTQLKAARIIAGAMANSFDDYDSVGDITLFYRLKKLGDKNLPYPALQIFGIAENMRATEAIITVMGTKFMSGDENFVKLNGIDDWVGGVHLTNDNQWFHDQGNIVRL